MVLIMKKIYNAIKQINKVEKTPYYIYSQEQIEENIKNLQEAFNWADFKEYFAVKATPNPHILKIMKNKQCGVDCSGINEIKLAKMVDYKGQDIFFTSNNTTEEEYKYAIKNECIINIDDYKHITMIKKIKQKPETISMRITPLLKVGNGIIGNPEQSKFGNTPEQIKEGLKQIKQIGIKKIGLHTMMVSNELKIETLLKVYKYIFDFVSQIKEDLKIELDFINLGGGIGYNYENREKQIDIQKLGKKTQEIYSKSFKKFENTPKIYMESGRYITNNAGYLITKVINIKKTYKTYIGVDAGMQNLMRPGMYGAYHEIEIINKDLEQRKENIQKYDIVGSLCENNDKFAIDRLLPKVQKEDLLIIKDVGAHGFSMGFNYNAKLKSAEYLIEKDNIKKIRRKETFEDYIQTIMEV